MVYLLVLIGSLIGLLLLLGGRVFLRNHSTRRFVRSVRTRSDSVTERGAVLLEETVIEQRRKSPRTNAIELQEVRSLVRTAEKAVARRRFDDAEKYYIKALTIDSDADSVRADLAKLYLTTDREAKAEALYKDLITRKDDVSFYSNLGLAYYQQRKYEQACHSYQEALNRDPANPERSYALGRACIAARRFQEAAPLLDKASQRLAKDTQLLHTLAECYLHLGHKDRAEETYRRINKLEPYDEAVKAKISSLARA